MENNENSRFFDLAMMHIAGRATSAEMAELNNLLAADPSLHEELNRMVAESQLLKEALPLANATQATEGEFPEWARANLQMEVQKVLGKSEAKLQQTGATKPSGFNFWAWGLGASAVWSCVVLILVVVDSAKDPAPSTQMASKADAPSQKTPPDLPTIKHWASSEKKIVLVNEMTKLESQRVKMSLTGIDTSPVIQLAILKEPGVTSGTEGTSQKDLQKAWPDAKLENFNDPEKLKDDWLWTGVFNPELVGKPMNADKLLASLESESTLKGSIERLEVKEVLANNISDLISSVRPVAKVLYISSTGELKIIFQNGFALT